MQKATPGLVLSGSAFPVRGAWAAVAAGLLFAFEAACKKRHWLSELASIRKACLGKTLAAVAVLGCDYYTELLIPAF